MVPFIDVTNLSSPCLINNPSYQDKSKFSPQICEETCHNDNVNKNMFKFTGKDFNETIFIDYVVKRDLPMIESGEISNWKINDTPSLINAFNIKINELETKHFNEFSSMKQFKTKSPLDFIRKMSVEKASSYFAMWENCNHKTSKIVKKLIRRPKFLSSSIELIGNNWIIMSNGYIQKHFLTMRGLSYTKLICQIKGSIEIALTPVEECSNECEEHFIILREGQIGNV